MRSAQGQAEFQGGGNVMTQLTGGAYMAQLTGGGLAHREQIQKGSKTVTQDIDEEY